jgi:hypothetical protein
MRNTWVSGSAASSFWAGVAGGSPPEPNRRGRNRGHHRVRPVDFDLAVLLGPGIVVAEDARPRLAVDNATLAHGLFLDPLEDGEQARAVQPSVRLEGLAVATLRQTPAPP